MSLKVSQLQEIATGIKKQQTLLETLKSEVSHVLGQHISISQGLEEACYQVNDILDAMKIKGDLTEVQFKTSLGKKLLESQSSEARRLATRTLPRNLITNLRFDSDRSVRIEACRRLPKDLVFEVAENYPRDFELKYIAEQKKKEADSHLHMYDEKRLGSAAKPEFQSELSDVWYRDIAAKFLQDYGTNIEYQWEEILINRFVASLKDSTRVLVDKQRLYDSLMELIKEKEDNALLKDEQKHIRKLVKMRENREIEDVSDTFNSLLRSEASQAQFVSMVNEAFKVKKSSLPPGIRKYASSPENVQLPTKATIPGGKITSLVERVLDTYVSKWNEYQALKGEPIKISWYEDPSGEGKVGFSAELR